jgi:hypothetical protein
MLDMKLARLCAAQHNPTLQFESDDALEEWKEVNDWEKAGAPHLLVRKWHRVVDNYEFSLFMDAAYGNRDYILYKGPKDDDFKVRSVDRDGFFGERIYDFYVEGDDAIKGRHDVIEKSFAINLYRLTKVRV